MKYDFQIKGEIGSFWGCTSGELSAFLAANEGKELTIAVCSPGGYVADGLEMYQALRNHGNVRVVIEGLTASAATIVAMGAKHVSIMKHSLILVHNTSTFADEFARCNKEQLQQLIDKFRAKRDELATLDDLLAGIYADRSGKDADFFRNLMTEAKWLTADQALEYGLVDAIVDSPDNAAKAVVNHYSSIINNKPRIMNETFASVCAVLAYPSLESKDGYVTLSLEDMGKIEDGFKAAADAKAKAEAALNEVNADLATVKVQLEALKKEITEKDAEIETLKNTAPAPTTAAHKETDPQAAAERAHAMFNIVSRF